jgi:hypothetical protein
MAAAAALASCQHLPSKQGTTAPPSTAASPAMTQAPPMDPRFSYKMADVESVTAHLVAGQSRQATVTISGLLNDGATSLHEIKQQRVQEGVFITVITSRPRDAMASLAIIPFERTVNVDLSGLPAGTAVITANGVRATLALP